MHDKVVYIDNTKNSIKKLLELINEFSKVPGYKINTQISVAFSYTINEWSERESNNPPQKIIPFLTAWKNSKPRNKFNQGGKWPILRKLYDTEERNWRRYK